MSAGRGVEAQNEFERVALPHSQSLLRVARRLTSCSSSADDLVQETLFSAWRGFHQFQPGTNIRAWLFRILFNQFYEQGRKSRNTPVMVQLTAASHVTRPAPDRKIEMTRALDSLPLDHRTVLLLTIVEGFTAREAAEILGVPAGTVMSRLSRAREAMRALLPERNTEYARRRTENRDPVRAC